LYQSLGFRSCKGGVCHDGLEFMSNCVTANLVAPLDHALEKLDVVYIPCNLAPIETSVFDKSIRQYRVSISDQEKSGWQTVLVKDGDGLFKLASQSVVKREGNKCWSVGHTGIVARHNCIASAIRTKPALKAGFFFWWQDVFST